MKTIDCYLSWCVGRQQSPNSFTEDYRFLSSLPLQFYLGSGFSHLSTWWGWSSKMLHTCSSCHCWLLPGNSFGLSKLLRLFTKWLLVSKRDYPQVFQDMQVVAARICMAGSSRTLSLLCSVGYKNHVILKGGAFDSSDSRILFSKDRSYTFVS